MKRRPTKKRVARPAKLPTVARLVQAIKILAERVARLEYEVMPQRGGDAGEDDLEVAKAKAFAKELSEGMPGVPMHEV